MELDSFFRALKLLRLFVLLSFSPFQVLCQLLKLLFLLEIKLDPVELFSEFEEQGDLDHDLGFFLFGHHIPVTLIKRLLEVVV